MDRDAILKSPNENPVIRSEEVIEIIKSPIVVRKEEGGQGRRKRNAKEKEVRNYQLCLLLQRDKTDNKNNSNQKMRDNFSRYE